MKKPSLGAKLLATFSLLTFASCSATGRAPASGTCRLLTKSQAEKILDGAINAFAAEIGSRRGVKDVFPMLDWDNREIDARLKHDGRYHNLFISRGMVQYPGMTEDTLGLVVAHEIGHLVARRAAGETSAGEGEADFFAAREGFARLVEHKVLKPDTDTSCSGELKDVRDFLAGRGDAMAERIIFAALQLRRMEDKRENRAITAELRNTDRSTVSKTITTYPSSQCRLDTAIAGALRLSRPRCWN